MHSIYAFLHIVNNFVEQIFLNEEQMDIHFFFFFFVIYFQIFEAIG